MRRERPDLIESSIFPGFYHNPVYDWLVVSREGHVIDQRNLFCPVPYMGGMWPYLLINIWGHGTVTLHRLVASTFLSCYGNSDDFVVNHLDGDKRNCRVDNLEWSTSSENAIHAYVTGLRPDNRPVIVKDLRDDKVEYFYSLNEAARRFGVNPSMVFRYLNSDSLVPWKRYYDMVYEEQSWRPLTKQDIGKVVNGQPKEVVVVDEKGNVLLFYGATSAARHFAIDPSTMYYYLSGSKKLPTGEFICYASEYSGDLSGTEIIGSRKKVDRPNFRRKPVPIVVKEIDSGRETSWDSVEEFAKSVGSSKNTVQKSMLVRDGNWRNYHIRYLK